MQNKTCDSTFINPKGIMNETEYDNAIESIKCSKATSKACYAILVSGYSSKYVCSAFSITRPTVNKYINLIKIEWRKNIANS